MISEKQIEAINHPDKDGWWNIVDVTLSPADLDFKPGERIMIKMGKKKIGIVELE